MYGRITGATILTVLASAIVLLFPRVSSGQRKRTLTPLKLESVKALVDNHTPDGAISGEITDRGLVAPPDDDWIRELEAQGAGPKTLAVLKSAVPSGSVVVLSSGADFTVIVDGNTIGTANKTNRIEINNIRYGTRQITVRKSGYFENTKSIKVSWPNTSVSFELVSSSGILTLTSDAPGALIAIDSFPTYTEKIPSLSLSQGTYTAYVSALGYSSREVPFQIRSGQTTSVQAVLNPILPDLIQAMREETSREHFHVAERQAQEVLSLAAGNSDAYLTLSAVERNRGNIRGFLDNARLAIDSGAEIAFQMVHVNDKAGAHAVTLRLSRYSIRFDKRERYQCPLPASAIVGTVGAGPREPKPRGRRTKTEIQWATVTDDKSGNPLLEMSILGKIAQLSDLPKAISSRDEYQVIQALVRHVPLDPRLYPARKEYFVSSSLASEVKKSAVRNVPALDKAIQAEGETAAIDRIRDQVVITQVTLYPSNSSFRATTRFVLPSYIREDSDPPSGRESTFTDGSNGWSLSPSGMKALTTAQIKNVLFYTDMIRRAKEDLSLEVVPLPDNAVQIKAPDGQINTLRFDNVSGLIESVTHPYFRNGQTEQAITTFSDWREIEGNKIAFHRVTSVNGQKIREDTIVDYRVNTGLRVVDLNNSSHVVTSSSFSERLREVFAAGPSSVGDARTNNSFCTGTDTERAPCPARILFGGYINGQSKSSLAVIRDNRLANISEMSFLRNGGEISHGGSLLAYDSCSNPNRGIYVASLDGSAKRMVRAIEGPACTSLRWSPDDQKISYVDPKDHTLHVIQADGNGDVVLAGAIAGWHSWSPKGDRLVFESGRGGARSLYLVTVGPGTRVVPIPQDKKGCEWWAPDWAPDGTEIVFTSCQHKLFTVHPDGSQLRELAPAAYSPRWSVDGRWIFFLIDTTLMRVRRDGDMLSSVTVLPYRGQPISLGPFE